MIQRAEFSQETESDEEKEKPIKDEDKSVLQLAEEGKLEQRKLSRKQLRGTETVKKQKAKSGSIVKKGVSLAFRIARKGKTSRSRASMRETRPKQSNDQYKSEREAKLKQFAEDKRSFQAERQSRIRSEENYRRRRFQKPKRRENNYEDDCNG